MENLNHLFVDAGTLMLVGMVVVFAFLSILIVFIKTVLAYLAKKFPDPVIQSTPQRNSKKPQAGAISPSVIAAISSAVSSYRLQQNSTK